MSSLISRDALEQGKAVELMLKYYNKLISVEIAEKYATASEGSPDICFVELSRKSDISDNDQFCICLNVLFRQFGFKNCYVNNFGSSTRIPISEPLISGEKIARFGFSFWFEKPNLAIERIINGDRYPVDPNPVDLNPVDETPVVQSRDGTTCETVNE